MKVRSSFVYFIVFSLFLTTIVGYAEDKEKTWFKMFKDMFIFEENINEKKSLNEKKDVSKKFKNLVYKHKKELEQGWGKYSILSEIEDVRKVFAKVFYTNANFLYTKQMDQFLNEIKFSLSPAVKNQMGQFDQYVSTYITSYYVDGKQYKVQYSIVKDKDKVNVKKITNNNGDVYQTDFQYVLKKDSLQADEFFNNKKFYSKKYLNI